MSSTFSRIEDEVAYVDECPSCGMAFLGMPPAEFREEHDCDPLATLYVFSKEATEL